MESRRERRFFSRAAGRTMCLAAAVAAFFAFAARAFPAPRDRGTDTEKSGAEMITPKTAEAIQKGLDFLAKQQQDDGSFSGSYGRNVAVVGLGGMAFIGSGSTPGRGPYGKQVDKCIDYILSHTEESGFINFAPAAGQGPMYGHGFATMFLAECYGMSQRGEVREKLTRAVQLIVDTQNKEGGWRYQPTREQAADISVTVCQVMALRAARNAGLHVPKETIEHAVTYIKKSQNDDGGFVYMLSVGGPSAFPRSAAAIAALYSAGIYEGQEIDKGLTYLTAQIPQADDVGRDVHYFYGNYYAVLAMWQAGGDYWKRWFPAIRDALVKRQADDGSWSDSIGTEYATAMGLIILQIPNNYLPIFQR